MNACHEPISWLRLEHYHLGELPPQERALVQSHLQGCPCCATQLQEIEDDARTLPPLPVPLPELSNPWWRRWQLLVPAAAAPAFAVALALLVLLPPEQGDIPGSRVAYKGGELAIALVRERAGTIQQDPASYIDGDRIKVLISTPPGEHSWDLALFQSDEVFFPLQTGTLQGRNRAPVGAFRLTGPGDATICALVGAPPERALLQQQGPPALGEGAACLTLAQVAE